MTDAKTDAKNDAKIDQRHHISSLLMRESLIDKGVVASTSGRTTVRMLPDVHVIKIGASSIIDKGQTALLPVIAAVADIIKTERVIVSTGGGARSRHVFSIGIDLGLPTGVLAQLAMADSNGNAHILGTLLAPYGVVAIPPEMFGHLLPFLIRAVPGVIFCGDPPYSLWEHPPEIGRIPPHRTDAGTFLLAECFGTKTLTLVKDVDGLYDCDPKLNPSASLIGEISVSELRKRKLATLPFDRVLIDLLSHARLVERFQVVNGLKPDLLRAAIHGEHVGTIIHRD